MVKHPNIVELHEVQDLLRHGTRPRWGALQQGLQGSLEGGGPPLPPIFTPSRPPFSWLRSRRITGIRWSTTTSAPNTFVLLLKTFSGIPHLPLLDHHFTHLICFLI
ncbi:hypothetical protein VNO78_23173 [Psophocarpus tetragonolobus]|uniref:Uncharacterized protein n=1 Tax=Psophocarpus tetragonolobus TaxID=3891 RepID=A0AAN9S3M4_PSOTE